MEIYLVRHGEADYELEKEPGEFPGVPLTAKGQQQAKELAEKLKNINFDIVVCSDMLRAKQTVEPLLKYLLKEPVYDSKLREISDTVTRRSQENWHKEPSINQKTRMNSFVEHLKSLQVEKVLVICHFGVIEFISELFGKKIISPECGKYYILEL